MCGDTSTVEVREGVPSKYREASRGTAGKTGVCVMKNPPRDRTYAILG